MFVSRLVATRPAHLSSALLDALFVGGLAGVFLVNALIATIDPQGFVSLVASGPLGGLAEGRAEQLIGPGIALNDASIGIAVLATRRAPRLRPAVFAWAGMWLLVVTVVKVCAI